MEQGQAFGPVPAVAAALRGTGRPTARASMDDVKNPWREVARDTALEGAAEAARVHRDRYHAARSSSWPRRTRCRRPTSSSTTATSPPR